MPTCQACGHPNPDGATVCELCATPLDSRPGVGETRLGEEARTVFEAGDLIAERYLVERVLGRGGMGVVYRARGTMLGERTVALKLIRTALATRSEKRFQTDEAFRRALAAAVAAEKPAKQDIQPLSQIHLGEPSCGKHREPLSVLLSGPTVPRTNAAT